MNIYPSAPSPEARDTPVIVTTSVRANGQASAVSAQFPLSGCTQISVLVEAYDARAVVLRELRPVVVSRQWPEPSRDEWLHSQLHERYFSALLDSNPPHVKAASSEIDFPFTVTVIDPEMFTLTPCSVDQVSVASGAELDMRGPQRYDHD